jgi:hypothetical protein
VLGNALSLHTYWFAALTEAFMYRRDFLKLSGLATAALFFQVNPLGRVASQFKQVESHGRHYRGTYDGKILMSTDAGKSWQLHTNFGTEFSIPDLSTDLQGRVHVQLEFANHTFDLALMKNGVLWKTL